MINNFSFCYTLSSATLTSLQKHWSFFPLLVIKLLVSSPVPPMITAKIKILHVREVSKGFACLNPWTLITTLQGKNYIIIPFGTRLLMTCSVSHCSETDVRHSRLQDDRIRANSGGLASTSASFKVMFYHVQHWSGYMYVLVKKQTSPPTLAGLQSVKNIDKNNQTSNFSQSRNPTSEIF